jgi:hypothetical protein
MLPTRLLLRGVTRVRYDARRLAAYYARVLDGLLRAAEPTENMRMDIWHVVTELRIF